MNQLFSSVTADLEQLTFSPQCASVAPIVRGLSVAQLIYIANQVIAGSSGATTFAAFKPAILNVALSLYNEAFDGCANASQSLCFKCGAFNTNEDDDDDILLDEPTTSDGLVDPGLFIGLNVFIGVTILLVVALLLCAWYYRRNKSNKQARQLRT